MFSVPRFEKVWWNIVKDLGFSDDIFRQNDDTITYYYMNEYEYDYIEDLDTFIIKRFLKKNPNIFDVRHFFKMMIGKAD